MTGCTYKFAQEIDDMGNGDARERFRVLCDTFTIN